MIFGDLARVATMVGQQTQSQSTRCITITNCRLVLKTLRLEVMPGGAPHFLLCLMCESLDVLLINRCLF